MIRTVLTVHGKASAQSVMVMVCHAEGRERSHGLDGMPPSTRSSLLNHWKVAGGSSQNWRYLVRQHQWYSRRLSAYTG